MQLKKRGFIGPLGDDIPSIFPIVAGVMLFITTLLFLNQQVSLTAQDFQKRQTTQELAYLATKRGYYTVEEFQSLCKGSLAPFATNNNLKFAVVIKRFCNQGCATCKKGIDLFNSNPFNADETNFPGNENPPNSDLVNNWKDAMSCTNPQQEPTPGRLSAFEEFKQAQNAKLPDEANKLPKDVISLNYPIAVPCPDTTSPYNGLGVINVLVWK